MKQKPAFTLEDKVTIVKEHIENKRTLREIVEEYDISKSYLCYLLKQYRESGKQGLAGSHYYTAECKVEVVKRHFEDGVPIAELVRETGIQYRMLKTWIEHYMKHGKDGFSLKRRGRPRQSDGSTPEERIKQLEMENEILRTFREERERWDAKK